MCSCPGGDCRSAYGTNHAVERITGSAAWKCDKDRRIVKGDRGNGTVRIHTYSGKLRVRPGGDCRSAYGTNHAPKIRTRFEGYKDRRIVKGDRGELRLIGREKLSFFSERKTARNVVHKLHKRIRGNCPGFRLKILNYPVDYLRASAPGRNRSYCWPHLRRGVGVRGAVFFANRVRDVLNIRFGV